MWRELFDARAAALQLQQPAGCLPHVRRPRRHLRHRSHEARHRSGEVSAKRLPRRARRFPRHAAVAAAAPDRRRRARGGEEEVQAGHAPRYALAGSHAAAEEDLAQRHRPRRNQDLVEARAGGTRGEDKIRGHLPAAHQPLAKRQEQHHAADARKGDERDALPRLHGRPAFGAGPRRADHEPGRPRGRRPPVWRTPDS